MNLGLGNKKIENGMRVEKLRSWKVEYLNESYDKII